MSGRWQATNDLRFVGRIDRVRHYSPEKMGTETTDVQIRVLQQRFVRLTGWPAVPTESEWRDVPFAVPFEIAERGRDPDA